jgi:hypothetical protein
MRRRIWPVVTAALAFVALAFSQGVAQASVSSAPALTPQLGTSGSDGTVEQIRQLAVCNNGTGGAPIMYAVGKFSQVKNPNSKTLIPRNNAFAFSAVAPYKVTSWNPNVNGTVSTVACDTDGSVLLGGSFSSAGGNATVKNIARVNNTTGAALPFNSKPGGQVSHIEVVHGHVLVGGYFPGYLKSLNPTTGVADGYGLPAISGNYVYPGAAANPTRIYNMTVSPNGSSVLMVGDFTSVGGQHHEQVFRLDLGATAATVNAWSPTELWSHCFEAEPMYAQDATWSPDGQTVYVAATGYHLAGESKTSLSSKPRTGPCDAAIAYPTTAAAFSGHKWINYTGCDSLFSVAADASTVFIGGHQRNIDNVNSCDTNSPPPPGRSQPGLGEIDPVSGHSQPGPNRGRGLGADDMLRTAAGLWIASDNAQNTSDCAGQYGHMGLCFLPN